MLIQWILGLVAFAGATLDCEDSKHLELHLKVETSEKYGIRRYYESTYTLSGSGPFGDRTLWSVTLNEKYLSHWIDAHGHVWVLTESVPGPGGTGRLWVRDTEARELLSLAVYQHLDAWRTASDPPKPVEVELEKSKFDVVGDSVQRLTLASKSGHELRIYETVQGQDERVFLSFLQTPAASATPLEALVATGETITSSRLPSTPSNWEVWRTDNTNRHPVLAIYRNSLRDGFTESVFVKKQVELDCEPVLTAVLPSYQFLWFDFGPKYRENRAKLLLYDSDANLVGSLDLAQAFGFKTGYEAARSIRIHETRIARDGQWYSLLSPPEGSTGGIERLRLSDIRDRVLEIAVMPRGTKVANALPAMLLEPETGPAMKEFDFPGSNLVKEERLASADGQFVFRQRWLKLKDGSEAKVQTLLKLAKVASDKTREVEVWSRPAYQPPKAAFVTNSGKVFLIELLDFEDPKTKERKRLARLSIWRYDGSYMGGLDLASSTLLSDYESASKADLSGLSVEYVGTKGMIDYGGLAMPRWESENYTWRVSESKAISFGTTYSLNLNHERLFFIGQPRPVKPPPR